MSTGNPALDAAIDAMSKSKVFGDFDYLKKVGKYRLQIVATKVKPGPKAIAEYKVVTSAKTQPDHEPHKVGDVVSYVENLSDPRKGGGSRFLKMVLNALAMTDAEISEAEYTQNGKTYVAQGENAKAIWLKKMLDETKQPAAFAFINCEIFPKHLDAEGTPGQPDFKAAKTISGQRWSVAEITEAELDAIEKQRAESKLPPLAEAMK